MQIKEKQSTYGSIIQNALFPEQAPEIRSLLGTLLLQQKKFTFARNNTARERTKKTIIESDNLVEQIGNIQNAQGWLWWK